MLRFAILLDTNPVMFWFLIGFIHYPAVMIIIFAIIDKIKRKQLTNWETFSIINSRKEKERK